MYKGPLNILYAGDKGYTMALFLSIESIARRTKNPIKIHLFSMTSGKTKGIEEEVRLLLETMLKDFNEENEIILYDATKMYEDEFKKGPNTKNVFFPPMCLLRLFAERILPKDIDELLYLDGDTLIYNPIENIRENDISEHEFGAVLDYLGKTWKNKNYFNSGVLYFNMKKCRETGLFEKCIEFVMTKKAFFPDQDALNKKNVSHLVMPTKFNDQRNVLEDTVVSHYPRRVWKFYDPVKPWMIKRMHKEYKRHNFDVDYDYYLEHFPFERYGMEKPKKDW